MNDDDLKKIMNEGIEPASELAKRRTIKNSSTRFVRKKSITKSSKTSYRLATMGLIAFFMFGALSYTVSQSTRSGSGSSDNETGLINSAQLTQYPGGLRTAVVRMIIGGAVTEDLRFDLPENLTHIKNKENQVFDSDGGGSSYAQAPAEVMMNGQSGDWIFNMELALPKIGGDDADLVAYLPGLAKTVCERINKELGINMPVPRLQYDQAALYTKPMVTGYVLPEKIQVLASDRLNGQPFGCFESFDGKNYIYYHVLVER